MDPCCAGVTREFLSSGLRTGASPTLDELFTSFTHYMNTLQQGPQESIREYVEREAKIWEHVQESVAQMDGTENIEDGQPIHDQLRGMLLLRRSNMQSRDCPLIFRVKAGGAPYAGIKKALLLLIYQQFRSLKGSQGSFLAN